MNKERVLQLADHLEFKVPQTDFDMRDFYIHHECGTAYCIAGHAVSLFEPEKVEKLDDEDWEGAAARILGFDRNQRQVFYHLDIDSPQHAAKVLRRMVAEDE